MTSVPEPIVEGALVTAELKVVEPSRAVVAHGGALYPVLASELSLVADLAPGTEVDVFLERDAHDDGLVAAPAKARALRLWEALEGGAELEGEVVAVVKGGLSMDVGTRAFLPASQVALR